MSGIIRKWYLIAALAVLAGCATVDFDYPKTESHALTDTDDTYMGRQVAGLAEAHPGESGFYASYDGIDALAVRLLLAERAERSIDAQYYLLIDDVVGYAFINSLLRAADRGVRVRLLLDDMFTKGYDVGMAALDSHPNFEVRIFNPFARRSARALDGVTSFSRINRRMHNKSFTIDNKITLIGGRNIAAEYFGARGDKRFGDLDVVGIGPVVQGVSDMFDSYWNYVAAAPVPAFAKIPDDPEAALQSLRERLEQRRQEIKDTPYAEAVRKNIDDYINRDEKLFTWAPYTLAYDSPDKSQKSLAAEAASIITPLRESILNAESEFLVLSPYFVPRKPGIEAFIELQNRGVDITVITNSLAANNQKTVHGGYAAARKPLLREGVRIFEVRADATIAGTENVNLDSGRSTLHTKAFVVDRKEAFIGSFNFDPRSAYINTELGVIIESPELAETLAAAIEGVLPTQTYEVFLNEKGKLRWRGMEDGQEVILDKEPQTGWWERFMAGFYRMLPIRGQL